MEKLLEFFRRFFPCVCCVLLLMSCVLPFASAADYGDSFGVSLEVPIRINSISIETTGLSSGDTTFFIPSMAHHFIYDGYATSNQFHMAGHSSVSLTATSEILRSDNESNGHNYVTVNMNTILDLDTSNIYSVAAQVEPFVYSDELIDSFIGIWGVDDVNMPFQVGYTFSVSYPKLVGNRFTMETDYVEVVSSESTSGEVPLFPSSYDMSRFPDECLITGLEVRLYCWNYDAGQAMLFQNVRAVESDQFVSVEDYFESVYVDAPIGSGSAFLHLVDFLTVGVGGFLDANIFGAFGIGDLLSIIVAVTFTLLLLKWFAGG